MGVAGAIVCDRCTAMTFVSVDTSKTDPTTLSCTTAVSTSTRNSDDVTTVGSRIIRSSAFGNVDVDVEDDENGGNITRTWPDKSAEKSRLPCSSHVSDVMGNA